MAFEGTNAGTKVGMEIWRIENMKPVAVPVETYGSFHSGDCYLVLNTYKKSEKSSKLDMDLHFWQGEKSSQDERGASAYRAVELDDHLGGTPVQHREVQHHESPRFLSYFAGGVKYLEGGVDSGFRHVDPDAYTARLFHVKGKRNVRSVQVELSAKSLNDGDVFILDQGLVITQWNGSSANRSEKHKALEIATKIKDSERGGKAKLVFLESTSSDAESAAFFAALGGSKMDVKAATEGGDDEAVPAEVASLWRVSDSTGTLQCTEVARGKLERSMLDDSDVFLLDAGGEVFVWIGKGASKDERAKGMQYGADYLATHNKPAWTPLTRLPGGGETPQFKSKFIQFDKEVMPTAEAAYVAKERKIELDALLAVQSKAEEKMIDNGSGSVTVWRIDNLKKVEVPQSEYGQFNSGDSYIVLYKYRNGNRDAYLLYMWQGRDSTTDEKAASALLTVDLASDLGDISGAQVRVVQNKEPKHFLALFKGKMVVRTAGGPSSSSSSSTTHLFHIRGSNAVDTRAVEVAASATSLNSGDCFVLLTADWVFNWAGKGSNDDEKATASSLAQTVLAQGRAVQEVAEGEESDAFWAALGGKQDYASAKHLQTAVVEPRLFQISGVTGNFIPEEIFSFSQDDLSQDSVFILDTFAEVYVWLGNNARLEDKDAALTMAVSYVQKATDGRSPSTPVFRVTAAAEPPTFTAQFLGWSFEKSQDFSDPYLTKLAALKAAADPSSGSSSAPAPAKSVAASVTPAAVSVVTAASSGAAASSTKYTLAELKAGVAGINAAQKETYLSDDEFKAALGVDREAFYKLAGWKQADVKKKAGIF